MCEELKPCPFCGGKAEIKWDELREDKISLSGFFIQCSSCGARTDLYRRSEKQELIDYWNYRRDTYSNRFVPGQKVKCCPMCGSEEVSVVSFIKRYVHCDSGRDCYISTALFETKDEAIEAWNRRSQS